MGKRPASALGKTESKRITAQILREIDGNPSNILNIRRKWVGNGFGAEFKNVFYDAPTISLSQEDFDVKRGIEVVGIVFDAVEKKEFVFRNGDLQGEIFPEGISKSEKALFLFYAAPLLPRTKSRDVYKSLCQLFSEHPDIFNPESARLMPEEELEEILLPRLNIVNRRGELPKKWKMLSEHLEKYGDNPLNLFSDGKCQESVERLDEVPYYGGKTANYFLNACVKEGLVGMPPQSCNFAVDVHKARFAVQTEMLKKERRGIYFRPHSDANRKVIEKYYSNVCNEGGFDVLKADERVWELSSFGCSQRKCRACPVDGKCTFGVWSKSFLDYGVLDTAHDYLGRAEASGQKKLNEY